MSDMTDAPAVDPAPVGGVGGQVEDVGGSAEVQADAPTLNVDEFANHHVVVKVDGEDVRVPLSEAVAGYSRQADYTRKTQEAASVRQMAEQRVEAIQRQEQLLSQNFERAVAYKIADGSDAARQAVMPEAMKFSATPEIS